MRRNISILLCILLCVSLLAGCGGEYAGMTEGDAVSGAAVSGEAVSGDAIQEKTVSGPAVKNGKDGMSGKKTEQDMSSHRFCTDTNLYYVSDNEEKLMQARTDGTHRKCIKEWPAKKGEENYVQVVYADENWLYYDVSFDCEKEITYRAPIKKDAQGYDVVKISKEEELVKSKMLCPLYVDSDYYFYHDLGGSVRWLNVKYDLKRKKKISETEENPGYGCGLIFRVRDRYIMANEGDIYIQNIDSTQWKKVSDCVDGWLSLCDMIVSNDEEVFYLGYVTKKKNDRKFDIKRHDGSQERDFVTWEQIRHAVAEAAGVEKTDVCMPVNLFWQNGKLYIQMQAGWMEGETYHMENMIFSQGQNKDGSGAGLRYEKELTECMKSHVKERSGKWLDDDEKEVTVYVEHMVVNDAMCVAMVDGVAYLSLYDYEKDRGRMACYDLDTGKLEWISKKDGVFKKLMYDDHIYMDAHESVFDGYDDNEFVDLWEWSPSKDEYNDGWFKED